MEEKIRPRSALNPVLFVLRIGGLYGPEETILMKKTVLYRCYSAFVFTVLLYIYIFTEIVNMYLLRKDIDKMTEASFLLLEHVGQAIKYVGFIVNFKRVVQLVRDLDQSLFRPHCPEHAEIIKNAMWRIRRDSIGYGVMTFFCLGGWGLAPLLDTSGSRELPFKTWYPFNTTQTPVYQLTYLYQMVSVVSDAFTNGSLDLIVSSFMIYMGAQLDMLRDSIMHIRKRCMQQLNLDYKEHGQEHITQKLHMHERTAFASDDFDDSAYSIEQWYGDKHSLALENLVLKNIDRCIQHHQEILRFLKEVQRIFSLGILTQFGVSTIIICFTAYRLTVIPLASTEAFAQISYMLSMLTEIFLYCWYGNEIIVKSSLLSEAMYESDWYRLSSRYKKRIFLMMNLSSKPIIIFAGEIFSLSLDTFTAILKSSYSFFTLLSTMDE